MKAKKLNTTPEMVSMRCEIVYRQIQRAEPIGRIAARAQLGVPERESSCVGITKAARAMGLSLCVLAPLLRATGRLEKNRRGMEYAYSATVWNAIAHGAGLVFLPMSRIKNVDTPSVCMDVTAMYDESGRRPQKQEAA